MGCMAGVACSSASQASSTTGCGCGRRAAAAEDVVTARKPSPQNAAGLGEPIVFVVDDDESFREALGRLFRSVGLRAEVFASASELLRSNLPHVASCLVLDVRLPGLSGLDFQAELAKQNIAIPIIFITGHGDIPMTVKAMKAGAIEFLTKPFREQDLLDAVRIALERDGKRREEENAISALRARYDSLSPREREVMSLVTAGLMNKQVAAETGLREITVKHHRAHITKKISARSFAELVRMAEMLGSRPGNP